MEEYSDPPTHAMPRDQWLSIEDAKAIGELLELHGWNQRLTPNGPYHEPWGRLVWGQPAAFYSYWRDGETMGPSGPITSWEQWRQFKAEREAATGQPSLF
jgi:hypothetical protein